MKIIDKRSTNKKLTFGDLKPGDFFEVTMAGTSEVHLCMKLSRGEDAYNFTSSDPNHSFGNNFEIEKILNVCLTIED